MDLKAFYSLSCGLYLVGATHEGKDYGCVVNTVTQVTAEPAKLMVAINKQNATTSAVLASGRFEAAVLCETAPMELIGTFGFQTSRETDKFAPFQTARDAHGVPYVTQDTAAHFSCGYAGCRHPHAHHWPCGRCRNAEHRRPYDVCLLPQGEKRPYAAQSGQLSAAAAEESGRLALQGVRLYPRGRNASRWVPVPHLRPARQRV